ncbi:MAG: hypothetical protein V4541_02300 [Bacteroidota bacterium]
MQHIQDKEFDQLFRDKFANAEIEPAANLWAKIEGELAPKRKRIFPIYWMAAASIAVAFTAMLFFQKTEKIQLHLDQTAANVVKEEEPVLPTTAVVNVSESKLAEPASAIKVVRVNTIEKPAIKNIQLALQPNTTTDRLPIKREDIKPIEVLPVKEVMVENPTVIAQVMPQQKEEGNVISETDNTSDRKGIRNVGDLVNFVVDKVDKRDQKFLKFKTDDDDNSSLIGINIGFVKLNKRHRD